MESSIKMDSDKYQFDIKDYKILRNIGSGNLGTCFLVQNMINNDLYVAKANTISNKTPNKFFISREFRILFQIQHPTLINYIGITFCDFDEKENIIILINYMEKGSLAELINKEQGNLSIPNYNVTKKQIILAGIARGMMVLHNHHIIQRYLKPENILLDSEYHPYITDYGISKIFDPCNSMIKSPSNSVYMAPEVTSSGNFTEKSDVYSFGIIMYEIVLGKRVIKDSENHLLQIKPGEMNEKLQKIIEKCLSENPNDRPTFSELYQKLSLLNYNYFNENDDGEEMKYCLDGVDLNEFLNYIDEVESTTTKKENQKEIELKKEIQKMEKIINEQAEEIQLLKKDLVSIKNSNNFKTMIDDEFYRIIGNLVIAEISQSNPGILYQLKLKEESSFRNKSFIVSTSKRDIFNLIDPDTNDCFCTINSDDFFIEFILEKPILIRGLEIFAAHSHFPQSFSIDIDGKNVAKIKKTKELNEPFKMMTVKILPIKGRKVKIILNGPSLDQRDNFVLFKRIEILTVTTVAEKPKEYFAELVNLAENKDPHRCPVYIQSSFFDFNSFVALDSYRNISVSGENSWFQIELTKGFAVLTGCRIKICKDLNTRIKNYKIICSDDIEKPLNSWITLLIADEKAKYENETLAVFKFRLQSPPVKFVRIVLTGPNWNNQFLLSFYHFDLFGRYF